MNLFGVGLRPKHYGAFLESSPRVDFVEAIAENFMGLGGRPAAVLEKVRRERPVSLHGVSLGIGSVAPLDETYLARWKELVARVDPMLVSDHLCWGRAHGRYSHDLLPLPFTEESLGHVVARVTQVQDFLGRRIALENVSSYFTHADSELTEWDFVAEVARRADCHLLLDVNNVFVSARNHGFDAEAYLAAMPVDRVKQLHLAGHQRRPELIIDTHDGPVSDEVWALYRQVVERMGPVPTLIEWDDSVPPLEELLAEADEAREHAARVRAVPREIPAAESRRAVEAPVSLVASQHTLFAAICDPEPVSEAAEALVVDRAPLSRRARIEVYAEMYWLRMRDVLRDSFAAVHRGVGDERFDVWVADFLRVHPSTQPSLDRLGAPFAAFLEARAPEWASLAVLEWARSESFVAQDASTVPFAALQAVAPEAWAEVVLALHPSVRAFTTSFDPRPSLRASQQGAPVPPPMKVAMDFVVWRSGFEVSHAPISAEERVALTRAKDGATLLDVLNAFTDEHAAFAALQSWFHEGMVSGLGSAPVRDQRADR